MNYLDLTFTVFDDHPVICLLFLWAFWWLIIPVWIILGILSFILKLCPTDSNIKFEKENPKIQKDRLPQLSEIYNKVHNA